MASPLESIGWQRAREVALESTVPITLAGGVWTLLYQVLSGPVAARPANTLEITVLLGALAAFTSWAAARQLYLGGQRTPARSVGPGVVAALVAVVALSQGVRTGFESACEGTWAGVPTVIAREGASALGGIDSVRVCTVRPVPGNAWLPGTLVRAAWDGTVPLLTWGWVIGVAALAGLAGRDRRLVLTTFPTSVIERLRWRPAIGLHGVLGGGPPADGRVVACANPTWWGTTCGQIYPASKEWEPGEWCPRCRLPFRRDAGHFEMDVVTLATGDVARLNAMERMDADAWAPGTPLRRSDGNKSQAARWVKVGEVDLPGVISVAQALAIVHDLLPGWAGNPDPDVSGAVALAKARASRLVAWVWAGAVQDRLHVATPTRNLVMVSGSTRLRDVLQVGGDRLTLQLDIGLLPLEVRAGYEHHLLPETATLLAPKERPTDGVLRRNLRSYTWIPTTPEDAPAAGPGVWVPRLEGDALRRWLGNERFPAMPVPGTTRPAPYRPLLDPTRLATVLVVESDPIGRKAMEDAIDALGDEASRADTRGARASCRFVLVDDTAAARQELADGLVDLLVLSAREPVPGLLAWLARLSSPPAVVWIGAPTLSMSGPGGSDSVWLPWPVEDEDGPRLVRLAVRAFRERPTGGPDTGAGRAPLDFVRVRLRATGNEPRSVEGLAVGSGRPIDGDPVAAEPLWEFPPGPRARSGQPVLDPGASIAEWDWFELPHLVLLRRDVLVLVEAMK
ncbi:MAG: hypothetical protein Q8P41_09965 [Pseudomonadota bacterium]|nr:hypothetical protein [Pseudomonadota bacterium]